MSKDYYKILEVDRTASSDDIKKSYRKMALKYHPDKNQDDPTSEAKFKDIAEAYEILSTPEKKEQYDRFGSVGNNGGGSPFGGVNMDDIFSQFGDMFGGFSNRRKRKGSDLRIKVQLDLNEIIKGTKKKLRYHREIICDSCNGKGGKDLTTCLPCQGTGHRSYIQNTTFGTIRQSVICSHCNGEGKIVKDSCNKCNSRGLTSKEEIVDIEIPKGAIEGLVMTMPQYGSYSKEGIPGDLQIIIEEAKDKYLKREGVNLIYDDEISIPDSILGVEKNIKTPHGNINYVIKPGSSHSSLIRINGKGIPDIHNGRIGDLFIRLSIKIPSKISKEEREIIEHLKKSKNFN